MSLSWNTFAHRENTGSTIGKKAKSTSSFPVDVPKVVKGLSVRSGRALALRNCSNAPKVERNASTASKKKLKETSIEAHKNVEKEPENYPDIEEMHIYPEEDDFEDIIPKCDRLTEQDLRNWITIPELPLLESPQLEWSFLDYLDQPVKCELPAFKESDLLEVAPMADIPFPYLSDDEDL